MKKEENTPPAERSQPVERDETQDADFQFVLKELLSAYQPILEEELRLAKSPDQLEKEAAANPPNCEEEFALANRFFEKGLRRAFDRLRENHAPTYPLTVYYAFKQSDDDPDGRPGRPRELRHYVFFPSSYSFRSLRVAVRALMRRMTSSSRSVNMTARSRCLSERPRTTKRCSPIE